MLRKWGVRIAGVVLILYFIYLSMQFFDFRQLKSYGMVLLQHPFQLILITGLYFLSFFCKALAWKIYLKKDISISRCLYALFYSLFVNHIAPIKIGDVIRVGVMAKEKDLTWDVAAHSVIVMRLLDLFVLGLFCLTGILYWREWSSYDWISFVAILSISVIILLCIQRMQRIPMIHDHVNLLKTTLMGTSGLYILALVSLSWVLEAFVVFGITQAIGSPLSIMEAIWVNSMTVAGQVFHLTPGGIGTYETVMSFSLYSIGYSLKKAYHVAMISHGYKFVFSYLIGIYLLYRIPHTLKDIMNMAMRRKQNEQV